MIDIDRDDFERWLGEHREWFGFKVGDANCCALAEYLKARFETHDVWVDTCMLQVEDDRQETPEWAERFIVRFDALGDNSKLVSGAVALGCLDESP